MTSYRFYKMVAIASWTCFRFLSGHARHLRKPKAIDIPNFDINPRPRYYYFRFLKTNSLHIEILLPGLILTFSLSLACDSALVYQILCKLDDRWQRYDVYWFYKMAAIAPQIYFRFLVWPRMTFKKVKNYRQIKFRPHISIHGRYITTSNFWKQTATISKF